MAPVPRGVALHHGHRVVLLLIAADESGNGIGVSGGIGVEVVSIVAVNHILSHLSSERDGQRWSQIEGRAEGRAPCGVGVHTRVVHTHIRKVRAQVELVQEIALLRVVEEVVLVVRADGQTVVVGMTEVTADDTLLGEVAQRKVVVDFLGGSAHAHVVLHNGCVVVEDQVLPVGAEAADGVTVGINEVVGVLIEGCHTVLHTTLVLQDGVVGGTSDVALLPSALPTIREVVVDGGFANLTLLRGDEDDTVGGTCSVDGARGSVLQHLDTLDVAGVHALHTVLVGRHTVYNIKRFGVVDGADTTDADHRLRTGLTRGGCDIHTCGHTFQGVLSAQTGLAVEVVG